MYVLAARASVLALTLALVVSCGGDDEGADSTTVSLATSASTATVSPEELDSMLLSVDDLGDAWQLGSPINEGDLNDSVRAPCGAPLDPGLVERLRAVTGIQFVPSDDSQGTLIEFMTTGEPTQLSADVQELMAAFLACPPTATPTDEFGYAAWESLDLPELGDQQLGFSWMGAVTPESEVVLIGQTAMVRDGSVFLSVGTMEMVPVGEAPLLPDEEFIAVVTAAVGHVTG
jgi:hypothetical protein